MDLARAEPIEAEAVVAVGSVDAIPAGPSVAERLAEIRRRIQRSVVYPALARQRGLGGVARIEFEIDPGGFAREIRIADSSGYGLLDRAAERGVAEAGSLPWVYGRLEVPVRFELHASR
jgi:protein TonB